MNDHDEKYPVITAGDTANAIRNCRFRQLWWMTAACLLVVFLHGCAGAVIAGAAAGGAMAADRRTAGAIVEDQSIELKAMQLIHGDEELAEKTNVSVTSYNGAVLLTGEAPTTELRDRLISLVRPIKKIKRIYNEIAIAAPVSLSVSSEDTLITGRVKSALLAAKGVNPLHVKVVTSKRNVYLMGLVTHNEAGFATDIVRRVDGVERVVRLFEYID